MAPHALYAQSNVIVLLAHPDDETWLSGSIAKLALHQQVHIVYATSGGAGKDRTKNRRQGTELAHAREAESRCAADKLAAQPYFLRLDDKNLEQYPDKINAHLAKLFDRLKPSLFISFAPGGITGHKDHDFIAQVAAAFWQQHSGSITSFWQVVVSDKRAHIAKQIAKQANYPQPIRSATPIQAINKVVDVSQHHQQRIDAFGCYPSQFPAKLQLIWQKFVLQTPYEEFIYLGINHPS
ncbi:PIG-L deacetylase family protein [Catenovulum agarivorans]|nr:PIG-L family deacetylase [Catenovulum agarivorans]